MTANTFQSPDVRTEAEKHAWYIEILAEAEKDQAVPQGFVPLHLFQARSLLSSLHARRTVL